MKHPKGMKKKKKDSIQKSQSEATEHKGCWIPLIDCARPYATIVSTTDRGVKMFCSNTNCPYMPLIVHTRCFEALENILYKDRKRRSSSRHWTKKQVMDDLWKSKCLGAYHGLLRCPCGGELFRHRDSDKSDFYYLEEENHEVESKLKQSIPISPIKQKSKTSFEASAHPRYVKKNGQPEMPSYQVNLGEDQKKISNGRSSKEKVDSKNGSHEKIKSNDSRKQPKKMINDSGTQIKNNTSSLIIDPLSSGKAVMFVEKTTTALVGDIEKQENLHDCDVSSDPSQRDVSLDETSSVLDRLLEGKSAKPLGIHCNEIEEDNLSAEQRFLPVGLLDIDQISGDECFQEPHSHDSISNFKPATTSSPHSHEKGTLQLSFSARLAELKLNSSDSSQLRIYNQMYESELQSSISSKLRKKADPHFSRQHLRVSSESVGKMANFEDSFEGCYYLPDLF